MDRMNKNNAVGYIPCKEWIGIKEKFVNYFASLEPKHSIVSSLGIKLKHSGYFAMIPSNFAIDAHLDQYPVTDYMFVEDNTVI